MEEAIAASNKISSADKRAYLLLALNLVGVLGCFVTTAVLILWARYIILVEPATSPLIIEYIASLKENSTTHYLMEEY